jgi:glycosyltransferase involved in cell wall biosynthesis
MDVFLVHEYYQQAGGEDVVFAAEKALLTENGHRVREYTDHNSRINEMRPLSVAIQTIWSRQTHKALLEILEKDPPDLIHFHNTFPLISPSAYYACFERNVPVVQTLHNFRLHCLAPTHYRNGHICEDCLGKGIPWPSMIHRCYRSSFLQTFTAATMISIHRWLRTWSDKVNAYIALSRFAKNLFVEGGLPEHKIFVKPNFVFPGSVKMQQNGRYFLFVGRVAKEKGVHTLIKAWETLDTVPLKIVGDGPEFEKVKQQAKSYGRKNIEFLGHCPHNEVLLLMKGAFSLIFPSECYESFGMTIIEAFSSGIPVIASNIGTVAEIIQDHANGLLFEPGNFHDLKNKVIWALSHPEDMGKMGITAKRSYDEKYTPEKNYQILTDIYKAILQEK